MYHKLDNVGVTHVQNPRIEYSSVSCINAGSCTDQRILTKFQRLYDALFIYPRLLRLIAILSTITRNPIHDQPRSYPRSHTTLSTISRDPIHDHAQPYPRSAATLSTITRNPIHDHARPCLCWAATMPILSRDHAYVQIQPCLPNTIMLSLLVLYTIK